MRKRWIFIGIVIFFSIITVYCTKEGGVAPGGSRLVFSGIGTHGIFDPSLTKDPSNNRLWMSYSVVDPSVLWPDQNEAISTRLAYSDDSGASWTDSGDVVNDFIDVTVENPPFPDTAGTWDNEVSTLIYDPGAASAADRWKLVWHHYLTVDAVNSGATTYAPGFSWLAYKAASSPEGLKDATEVKLFVGTKYKPANDTLDGASRSPVGGSPYITLPVCKVLSEPGLYATNTALYLSLLCINNSGDRIILLMKCSSPCNVTNSGSWSVSTIVQDTEAGNLGYDHLSAPAIFAEGGNVYLILTPTSPVPVANAYNGCRVFQFTDISIDGTLVGGATPTIIKSINGTSGSFNGACGYHPDSSASGFIYSEVDFDATEKFRMFFSREHL